MNGDNGSLNRRRHIATVYTTTQNFVLRMEFNNSLFQETSATDKKSSIRTLPRGETSIPARSPNVMRMAHASTRTSLDFSWWSWLDPVLFRFCSSSEDEPMTNRVLAKLDDCFILHISTKCHFLREQPTNWHIWGSIEENSSQGIETKIPILETTGKNTKEKLKKVTVALMKTSINKRYTPPTGAPEKK